MALRPLLAPPRASSTGHPAFAPNLNQGTSALELEFVFESAADADAVAGPHPHPYRNPNRPGTPLHFWREVKDTLRRLVTGHDKRGSYLAPGPGNRRNNIEPEVRPSRAHGQLATAPGKGLPKEVPGQDSTSAPAVTRAVPDTIAQMSLRHPSLLLPPLPDFPRFAFLRKNQPAFRGEVLKRDHPIRYKQQVLFIGGTDEFVSKIAARRVLNDLLTLMLDYPEVQVEIQGNAAEEFRLEGFGIPYGSNKKLLMRYPQWGIVAGKAYYGDKFRTIGDLMLGRAKAIGKLLVGQGIAPSRIHYSIGTLGYGKRGVPGSAEAKRRATIIINYKP